MENNLELPKFLESLYDPNDKYIPGCITVRCVFEDEGWPGRIIKSGFNFQYLEGKVFYHVYPTGVQLLLGNAATVDEAIEIAKQFLRKWLSSDIKHRAFQREVTEKILHLEAIQRAEKEQRNREASKNISPETLEKLQEILQKTEEKKKKGE